MNISINLLFHPIPYELESLSNYISRLIQENACQSRWLDKYFNTIHIPDSLNKYNMHISEESLQLVSRATGYSLNCITKMTIYRFNIFKNNYPQTYANWKDLISTDEVYFCPLCLKENYYKRITWCLKHIKICLPHSVSLIGKCTNCKKPLKEANFTNGCCSCGTKLIDMSPTKITNNTIIQNQERLYSLYDIISTDKHTNLLAHLNINSYDFIVLTNFLTNIINKHSSILESISISSQLKYKDSLGTILFIEEIFADWPNNFYNFIDLLNAHFYKEKIYNERSLSSCLFTPLSYIIKLQDQFSIFAIEEIQKILYRYFYKRYNFDFFYKNFNYLITGDTLVSTEMAEIMFNLSSTFIRDIFDIQFILDNSYVNLEELVNYFIPFIKLGSFKIINRQISIPLLYKKFSKLEINLSEILNIILRNNIKVWIDPSNNGLSMINVPENEVKLKIYELLISKIKNN